MHFCVGTFRRNDAEMHFEWNTFVLFSLADQSNTQGAVSTSTKAAGGPEFKERAAFNRRRGAMRRRVHQVK